MLSLVIRAACALLLALVPARGLQADECPRFHAASRGLPTDGEWRTIPALGDVNGDGRLDLAAHPRKRPGPRVWLSDGNGGWKPASGGLAVPEFGCGVGVELADVNADGHVDLAVADHCKGIFLFLGDGGKAWTLAYSEMRGENRGYNDLEIADLDGDGRLDLLAIGAFRGGLLSLLQGPDGRWSSTDLGLPKHGYGTTLRLADVNGDGRQDVGATFVAGSEGDLPPELRHNVLWLRDADGRFRPASPGLPSFGVFYGIAFGEVNGDGKLDLALTTDGLNHPPALVYLGDGGKTWRAHQEGFPAPPYATKFWGVALEDLDGDGRAELLLSRQADGGIELWRQADGRWGRCEETGLPAGEQGVRGWGLAVGDVNRDGKLDVAAGRGRTGSGGLGVWLQEKGR